MDARRTAKPPKRAQYQGGRPRQAGNDRAADDGGHGLYGFEVAIGGDRESGLDHVHAKAVELMRQAQLFLIIHAATGRLFTVAESGVENV